MARTNKCCAIIRMKEDNARFILLAFFILFYWLMGATIFHFLEKDQEKLEREEYTLVLNNFTMKYIDTNIVKQEDFNDLLESHEYAVTKGLTAKHRDRWDFSGAFYFVGTVVSTIGFGMTSPSTNEGKVFLILYGVPGCAATILFFNLFLERLITFVAYVLKEWHRRNVKRRALVGNGPVDQRIVAEIDEELERWKPSVYRVMVLLGIAATIIALCASAMYSYVEEWDYFESFYFCFVAFSTIGFGDYVTSQKTDYDRTALYRFGNFWFLVAGVCCIYSMYNVGSIVIKQFLNFVLKKLECRCCQKPRPRPRRNAITPGHMRQPVQRTGSAGSKKIPKKVEVQDVDSNYDSDTEVNHGGDGRRNSGEMISLKDFLAHNKVSLAVMQKKLYDSQNNQNNTRSNGALGMPVGGVAILNDKLQETDRRD
ncbi:potassium channel subfamily K member 13-like [Anneissia japonica]|uniref:potassium channel subfamily K member 13-like n=1 Tax=Anneissia japonica TaxID=1529436 RepID=UPI0014256DED|nr:potassium channel subfamily K member 13-like [Anneissia japonica]